MGRLNAHYYINKIIVPAMDRILSLAGGDIRLWLSEMPRTAARPVRMRPSALPSFSRGGGSSSGARHTIDSHFLRRNCLACDAMILESAVFCASCGRDPQRAHLVFMA